MFPTPPLFFFNPEIKATTHKPVRKLKKKKKRQSRKLQQNHHTLTKAYSLIVYSSDATYNWEETWLLSPTDLQKQTRYLQELRSA